MPCRTFVSLATQGLTASICCLQASDALRSENEELQKVINNLEADGASAKTDLQQVTAQYDQSVAESNELTAKIDELIDSSTKDKALLQADIDSKATAIASFEEEVDTLKATIESSNAEYLENITAARNELDEQLAKQVARAAAAETEITKVNTQAEALKSRLEVEVAEKAAQLKQAGEIRSAKETEVEQVKKELQLSQDEVYKKDSAIEGLKVNVDSLKVENLEVKKQAKTLQDELSGFKAGAGGDINVLKLEIETQKKTVERRDGELATAQGEVESLRESLTTRTQELSDQKVLTEKVTVEKDALALQVDKLKTEYQAEIQKVTTNFQEEREVASTRFAASIAQLEETMKATEGANQQQFADMTEQRKRVEDRNEALQGELTGQARKYKDVSEQIVDVKTDLSKAQLTISQNAGQFKQLAKDLQVAGQLNDSLKDQLEAQKADWDADKERASGVQAEMGAKIAAAEQQVSAEQAKVLAAREEIVNIEAAAEASQAEAKTNLDRVIELEQTVSQMEEAAEHAEALREEIRQQHQSDLENGTEEREMLAKKVADLTADCNTLQLKLDQTRQELLEARQNFSEETVRREARDAEVANGKMREEQLAETLRAKDEALAASQEAALDGEKRGSQELSDSQAKVEQLQGQIDSMQKDIDQSLLDISTWKSTAQENATKRDEFTTLSDANAARADEAEGRASSTASELAQAQSDWQAEVASKEEEKLALAGKDEVLMQEMSELRTQMEQESSTRQESANAQLAAEDKLSETEALLAELQGSRTELEGKYTDQSSELAELKSLLSKTEQEANDNQSNFDAQSARMRDEATDATAKYQESLAAKEAAEKTATDAEAARQTAEDSLSEATRARDDGLASLQQAQDELTAKLEELATITTANDDKQGELSATIDQLQVETASLKDTLSKTEASLSKAEEDLASATTAQEEAEAARKELEDWKADALVEQEAEHQHLQDTSEKMAGEIQTIKSEEANHKAQKELADKKSKEAQAAKEAADAAAAAAVEAKNKAAEEMRIAAADAEAKAAKIAEKESQLASAKESVEKATAAQAEAKALASSLTDEVGLLKKQAAQSSRQAEVATSDKEDAEARVQSMDAMAIKNNKLLQELRNAYKQTTEVKNQQKDTMGKLLDLVSTKEAEAKAAKDAIKDGKAAEPVLSQLRQEADTLNSAVQAAAQAFDAKSGLFEPGETRKNAAAFRSMAGEDLSPDMSKLVSGGSLSSGSSGAAPKKKPSGGASAASGGGGGGGGGGGDDAYSFLEGTLEKGGSGKKKAYKKRHFKLGKNTLTYAASAKPDAKVLGIIQLSGGSVKQNKEEVIVVDGGGRSNGAYTLP